VASRSVGEKIKKVTNIVYFTYLPRSRRCFDRHQICSGGWYPGRNQLCQISFQSVQGFWFCRGSNFGLSHRNEVSPLTQGLNYRSACDRKITALSSLKCSNVWYFITSKNLRVNLTLFFDVYVTDTGGTGYWCGAAEDKLALAWRRYVSRLQSNS